MASLVKRDVNFAIDTPYQTIQSYTTISSGYNELGYFTDQETVLTRTDGTGGYGGQFARYTVYVTPANDASLLADLAQLAANTPGLVYFTTGTNVEL